MSKVKQIKRLLDDCRASGCNDEATLNEVINMLAKMPMEPKKGSEHGKLMMVIKVYDNDEHVVCHVKECEPCQPEHVKGVRMAINDFIDAKKKQIDAELPDVVKDVLDMINRRVSDAKGKPA